MIQKQTRLEISDNSGAKLGKCIRVLKGSSSLTTGKVGDKTIVSIRKLKMKRRINKKDIILGLIIRTVKENINKDGSYSKFKKNAITLLNKKGKLLTTKTSGPISKNLRSSAFRKIYLQLKLFIV